MQTATPSGVGKGSKSTDGESEVQQWHWNGKLSGEAETGEHLTYDAIINVRPDEGIEITLFDGSDSFTTRLKRDQLVSLCEKPSLAHVDPLQRMSRIQAALKNDEKETTRVIRSREDLELRISTPWGSEFGDLSIKLDIAGIPLHRSPSTDRYLTSALERLAKIRVQSPELRDESRELQLGFEELWEANKRLEVIIQGRNERMQVFADTVNEYKKRLLMESTK